MRKSGKRKQKSIVFAGLASGLLLLTGFPASSAGTDSAITEREAKHALLSMEAAAQGMVLLENKEQALPIAANGGIALFGGGAVKTIKGGTGSGDVNQRYTVSVWEGFQNAGYTVTSSDWLHAYEEAWEKGTAENEEGFLAEFTLEDPILTREDVETAKAQDTVDTAVYVIARNSGEGKDRTNTKGDYELTAVEKKNLELLADEFERTIVLLNVGGVIDTGFFEEIEGLDAMVLMSQAGMEGGTAAVKVLNGEVTPSGKLTDTWPLRYSDCPSSSGFGGNDGNAEQEIYMEGIYVGYRYYDTFGVPVAYPFGYGLSYTDFSIDTESVEADENQVTVKVRVTNTGTRYSGKEVVEVYFSPPEGKLEKPYQELGAYAKTDLLEPGQSQSLTIRFLTGEMSSYSVEKEAYLLEPGDYVIRVGNSSRNTKAAAVLRLDAEAVTEQLSCQFEPTREVKLLTRRGSRPYTYEGEAEEIAAAPVIDLRAEKVKMQDHTSQYEDETVTAYVSDTTETEYLTENLPYTPENSYSGPYREHVKVFQGDYSERTLKEVYDGKITLEEFISGLTVSQMADLVIGGNKLPNAFGQSAGASSPNVQDVSDRVLQSIQKNSVQGAAGETAGIYLESKGIPSLILADGPAGLRLTPEYEDENGEEFYQYCTAWPIGTLLASSWDPELLSKVGAALGEELKEYGVTMLLAPGMNIHRNSLCGRNFEYYSEDPYLTGTLGIAQIRGIQSVPGVGCCIKHLAANNQEENRTAVNNHIDERTFREIYLKGFEMAVKGAQPMAIMTSYNQNNGIPSADDYDLLTDAVRGEWGFEGLIMTDWGGGQSTPSVSMHAGNDLIMPGKSVEDILVRGFADEAPVFGSDDLYPVVTVKENWFGAETQTAWGEFVPDAQGDCTIIKTVDSSVFFDSRRSSVSEDGEIRQVRTEELLLCMGDAVTVLDNGDGTMTVIYRGSYRKNNITLGDLQKSVYHILKIVLQSGQFAQMHEDAEAKCYGERYEKTFTEYWQCERSLPR